MKRKPSHTTPRSALRAYVRHGVHALNASLAEENTSVSYPHQQAALALAEAQPEEKTFAALRASLESTTPAGYEGEANANRAGRSAMLRAHALAVLGEVKAARDAIAETETYRAKFRGLRPIEVNDVRLAWVSHLIGDGARVTRYRDVKSKFDRLMNLLDFVRLAHRSQRKKERDAWLAEAIAICERDRDAATLAHLFRTMCDVNKARDAFRLARKQSLPLSCFGETIADAANASGDLTLMDELVELAEAEVRTGDITSEDRSEDRQTVGRIAQLTKNAVLFRDANPDALQTLGVKPDPVDYALLAVPAARAGATEIATACRDQLARAIKPKNDTYWLSRQLELAETHAYLGEVDQAETLTRDAFSRMRPRDREVVNPNEVLEALCAAGAEVRAVALADAIGLGQEEARTHASQSLATRGRFAAAWANLPAPAGLSELSHVDCACVVGVLQSRAESSAIVLKELTANAATHIQAMICARIIRDMKQTAVRTFDLAGDL